MAHIADELPTSTSQDCYAWIIAEGLGLDGPEYWIDSGDFYLTCIPRAKMPAEDLERWERRSPSDPYPMIEFRAPLPLEEEEEEPAATSTDQARNNTASNTEDGAAHSAPSSAPADQGQHRCFFCWATLGQDIDNLVRQPCCSAYLCFQCEPEHRYPEDGFCPHCRQPIDW